MARQHERRPDEFWFHIEAVLPRDAASLDEGDLMPPEIQRNSRSDEPQGD